MIEQDFKRIKEISYLNTDNTPRYRRILHFCFKKHEHMQTYIYPEDIFHELRRFDDLQDYTFDQLEQDLGMLSSWGNLIAHQETGNKEERAREQNRRQNIHKRL